MPHDRCVSSLLAAVPLTALSLTACAPINIPRTATPDIAAIVAATQRAAPTRTEATSITLSLTPAATLTSTAVAGTPQAAQRISLISGATSAMVHDTIEPGETHSYVVRGAQAQPMLVNLASETGDATLIMMSQGGTYFVRPGIANAWRGTLPQAGDYFLSVCGGASRTPYSLSLQLVTRIVLKEEEDAVTLAGTAHHGSVATYSIFAPKGDRMTVAVSHVGRDASLGIVGFRDEDIYLDPGKGVTYIKFDIPVTQDYVIEIVPHVLQDVDYILDIRFE